MKANELRIGNYVTVIKTNGTIEDFEAQIQCADITRIFDKCFNIWNYRPITLTEEWLVNFGFVDYSCHINYNEKCIKSDIPSRHVVVRFGKQRNYFTFFNHSECNFTDMQFLRELEYVHQLQNIYFALTGIELEINL